jgi:hypothetical protein
VDFPAHLLDELARVFARAALNRLLEEVMEAATRECEAPGSSDQASKNPETTREPSCEN